MTMSAVPEGVTLTRNSLGGLSIEWDGTFVGWLYEGRDGWSASICGATVCDPGVFLGRFGKDEAVRRVLTEAGWPGPVQPYLIARRRAP
jgi:hypothetical protein